MATTEQQMGSIDGFIASLDMSYFGLRLKEREARRQAEELRELAKQQSESGQITFALTSDAEARIASAEADAYGFAASAIEVAARSNGVEVDWEPLPADA